MTWYYWLAMTAWLYLATVGGIKLYIGYGFAMCAKRARDDELQPAYVVNADGVLAVPIVLRDALYNLLVMPVLCLDLRLTGWFRFATVKGVTFPVPELVTERMRLYYVNPNEWVYRRSIALRLAPFLEKKDPKGWHLLDPRAQLTEA